MASPLHVVFGAGQIGSRLARSLAASGTRVRVARRSDRSPGDGIEVVPGDAADAKYCEEAARGAEVVYHCMNPAYDRKLWADLVPRYARNLVAAAARAGARLVVLDNLYMVGRPSGPIDEATASNPCSVKGEIRAEAAEIYLAAHRRGEVLTLQARASDYYGPEGTETHLGEFFWKPLVRGGRAKVLVDPDAVHTYHYIPDVAEGLRTLGAAPVDAYGGVWMLPCAPAGTLRDLARSFEDPLGKPVRITRMPAWAIRAAGLASPLLREIGEMLHEWEVPFVVDDRKFRSRFGDRVTPREIAARETVAWAQSSFGIANQRTR